MTKEQIYDYIMKSPENTNPMILKGMLDEISNGGVRVISFTDIVVGTSPENVIDYEMYNICEPIDRKTLENALFILADDISSSPDTFYVYWNKFGNYHNKLVFLDEMDIPGCTVVAAERYASGRSSIIAISIDEEASAILAETEGVLIKPGFWVEKEYALNGCMILGV